MPRLPLALCLLAALPLAAQDHLVSSRHGFWMPNRDTVRVFLVFAEVVGDPDDRTAGDPNAGWPDGRLPPNADAYFDPVLPPGAEPRGDLTRFFHQASFGRYVLLGDYLPELVRVPVGERQGNGDRNVLAYLAGLPPERRVTAHGLRLDADFDRWTMPNGKALPKTKAPDGMADFGMIVWRVNGKVSRSDNGGSVNVGPLRSPVGDLEGFNDFSRFVARHSAGFQIMKHEFSHSLYGGNNFHTGGRGAGNATFIHAMGGYGNLSSFGSNSPSLNAWDRHRMGWKPEDKRWYVSATCAATGEEVPTDLAYGDTTACPGMAFWLDDFSERGDALRIRLPYLRDHHPEARAQYLWLENHQKRPGRVDHPDPMPRGVYAYVQVGKDDTTDFGGPGLYTAPLHGLGHWDLAVDPEAQRVGLWDGFENPFTGLHLSVIPAVNRIEPNVKLSGRGDTVYARRREIFREETVYPESVVYRGRELPPEDFVYSTHPALGTAWDGFGAGTVLAVGRNPAPTPWLTWEQRGSNGAAPFDTPRPEDNRTVPLNGIRVELKGTDREGRMLVAVSWRGEPIGGRQRWCGPLVAHEDLRFRAKARVDLDQGLTPTRPVAPLRMGRLAVFADTTTLTLWPGTTLRLDRKARLTLRNGARLVVLPGATLDLGEKARVQAIGDAVVDLRPGSRLLAERKARLEGSGVRDRSAERPFGAFASADSGTTVPKPPPIDEPDLPAGGAAPFTAVTVNVRYDNPEDGLDAWPYRYRTLAGQLRETAADLIGVQEALAHQVADLDRWMPGYAYVGAGRDDGAQAGEWCAIFYDGQRFERLADTTFWLSPTPAVPSLGWDAALPRIVTGVRLRDRASGRTLWALNTHWDHRGAQARERSAEQLLAFAAGLPDPVVLLGDLNTAPHEAPLARLLSVFTDARSAVTRPGGPPGTFWGFEPADPAARRIDYILVRGLSVLGQEHLEGRREDGRKPSDHLPVRASLAWPMTR